MFAKNQFNCYFFKEQRTFTKKNLTSILEHYTITDFHHILNSKSVKNFVGSNFSERQGRTVWRQAF
jgi:hypothetical protein